MNFLNTPEQWLPKASDDELAELRSYISEELMSAEFDEDEFQTALKDFDDSEDGRREGARDRARLVAVQWSQQGCHHLLRLIDQEIDARCPDAKLPQ